MTVPFSAVKAAAGLTNEGVANACGIAKVTYETSRKDSPERWKLEELRGYYNGIEDYAKPLLLQAVADFICS